MALKIFWLYAETVLRTIPGEVLIPMLLILFVISKFKGIFALVQPAIQKATWNVSIKKTTLVS